MHIPAWPLGASSRKEDFGQIFFFFFIYRTMDKAMIMKLTFINEHFTTLSMVKEYMLKYCLFKLVDWEWTMLEGELAKCN